MMVEGLQVTVKYRGAKYDQVAAPPTSSSAFAILKKDLAHLRVHSPSRKNVRRVGGSFVLHWPNATTSPKVAGVADSLHTRWFKLCSDDPEALKLREFLSIESITMMQDGVLIRATASKEQASQDASQGANAERISDSLPETGQQPTLTPAPTSVVFAQPPLTIPPPRIPPTAPRSDRQTVPQLPLKRRMSDHDSPSSATRQRLDIPEAPAASPHQAASPLPTQLTSSPKVDITGELPTTADTPKTVPQPTRDNTEATPPSRVHTPTPPRPPEPQTIPPSPSREPGEMTPHPTIPPSGPPRSVSPTRPPPLSNHHLPPSSAHLASPYQGSTSSANGDLHGPRRRHNDVNELMRALWGTRRELTAVQARERVILDDLDRLGVRPDATGCDRASITRDELMRLEADLKSERARRVRAERALSDVERECRTPFVVPALFHAFLSISELSE